MRQAVFWFFLSCRRYLKRLSFLAILLALPAAAFLLDLAGKSGDNRIRIAVCTEPAESMQTALSFRLLEALTDAEGMFSFYACEDAKQVKEDVASRRAECGYVIAADLGERMEKKDYKRAIRVFSAPKTVTAELSQEVVFAELISLYDPELFSQYVESGSAYAFSGEPGSEERKALAKEAAGLYDRWAENGSTFRFSYETVDAEVVTPDAGSGVFPVRGLAAVFVYVTGIYAAAVGASDQKRGLFVPVPWQNRAACRIASMAASVVLAALSGLFSLAAGGELENPAEEVFSMAFYAAAVLLFSWLLCLIFRRPGLIGSLLPFFLMGSLLFCPVFADAARFLPEAGWIGRLFLPWYYLHGI